MLPSVLARAVATSLGRCPKPHLLSFFGGEVAKKESNKDAGAAIRPRAPTGGDFAKARLDAVRVFDFYCSLCDNSAVERHGIIASVECSLLRHFMPLVLFAVLLTLQSSQGLGDF